MNGQRFWLDALYGLRRLTGIFFMTFAMLLLLGFFLVMLSAPELALHAQAAASKGATPTNAPTPQPKAPSLLGTWRVSRGVAAPWLTARDARPDTSTWIGRTIRFSANTVSGPEALQCANARYELTSVPAEGLFQGTLTSSAKAEALQVGLAAFPVAGTSLTCDTGIFEFHFADSNTALLGMSNAVWTLDRSPGALAAAATPPGVVQRFLEAHFSRAMGFSKANTSPKVKFMTAGLNALVAKYLALPGSPDEAPVINGDPFTDSQEYPTRFSVGTANTSGAASIVRVRFSDGLRVRTVAYHLQRESSLWRIDDVRYESGPTFRTQLSSARR